MTRRGISYIAKRYSKSDNICMKNYNPKKPSEFITYLDLNHLYGWAMSSCLPYGRFNCLKNVDGFDVNSILNILINYKHCTIIILVPQKNLQFLMTCCQIIVKKLLTNMK